MGDIYHTVVNTRTSVSVFLTFIIYNVVICLFAGGFMYVGEECNIGIETYLDGYYFSLETIMTIGFGARDKFFGGCWKAAVLIMFESICGILLDAVCFGLIYARISRGHKRASTMIFSDKAIIREIRGHLYFMFQVVEMRDVQLIEGHVRAYAVRHLQNDLGERALFQSHNMRLQHPDDESGGMLLLSLPSLVVHRIDNWSPMMPWSSIPEQSNDVLAATAAAAAARRGGGNGLRRRGSNNDSGFPGGPCGKGSGGGRISPGGDVQQGETSNATDAAAAVAAVFPQTKHDASSVYRWPDVMQRECDVESGNRECQDGTRKALTARSRATTAMRQRVSDFIRDSCMEVIAVVEGICITTSDSLQCRHSYTHDDIVWDHTFAPCVFERPDGGALLDFSSFHDVVPIPQRRPGVTVGAGSAGGHWNSDGVWVPGGDGDGINDMDQAAAEAAAERGPGESGFNVFDAEPVASHA